MACQWRATKSTAEGYMTLLCFIKYTYSETCIRRNRMGPKIFSTLDKFPHYTKKIALILLAGTIEFVHIEQISALFKFRLIQVPPYTSFTVP
jgi:hypothetical protein